MLPGIQKTIEKMMSVPSIRNLLDDEVAKHEANILQARSELCQQMKDLEDDFHKILPVKKDAVAKSKKNLETAEAALGKARAEYGLSYQAEQGFITQYDRKRSEIELLLKSSADPRIADAIIFFKNTQAKSFIDDRVDTSRSVAGYKVDGTPLFYITTNRPAIIEKHAYLRAALDALEAMKLQPVYDDAAIQALIDGIPAIEMSEVK